MEDLKWLDAIERVLEEEKKVLNYNEIAELISEKGYRKAVGATPANSVYSRLYIDIQKKGDKSIFQRIGNGEFVLKKYLTNKKAPPYNEQAEKETEKIEKNKIINAFGIYWYEHLVHWKIKPDLLGIQQNGEIEVNFKDQIGIYLLHDNRETIYVGQSREQTIGERISKHTRDRLSGRWNRFSWFGLYPVTEKGEIDKNINTNIQPKNLIDTLEALLIESIEPRQNRKQGESFYAFQYLQKESPESKKKRAEQMLKEAIDKI